MKVFIIRHFFSFLFLFSSSFLISCGTFQQQSDQTGTGSALTAKNNETSELQDKSSSGDNHPLEINIENDLKFDQEVQQVQELNQLSYNASNKSSSQQLLDSLFINNQRSPKEIKSHYYNILRNKKRTLRKKISTKKRQFLKKQREERRAYLRQMDKKKKVASLKKMTSEKRRAFFSQLSSERKTFFSSQQDKERVFDSNIKSYEKEIDSRLGDLTKEFHDRLKVYEINYQSKEK